MAGAKNVAETVWQGIQPVADELGLTIWDVEFVKEGARRILRVTIDHEDGITIEDCEKMHRAIDPLLDDPTPVPYQCPDDVRLDTQGSKDVLNLAFMYRMTGDEAYLNRAWVEMEALCGKGEYAYPDWHPSHLLVKPRTWESSPFLCSVTSPHLAFNQLLNPTVYLLRIS